MIRHWSDKRGSNTRPWILDFFHGPISKGKRICWKNTHLPYNLYFQTWRKKGLLILHFLCWREFSGSSVSRCMRGLEDGTEDDGTEGGRSLTGALGQIWVNPAFTELTAYYSLAQYRDSDLIQCGWGPDRAYSDRQDEQIWNTRQNGNLDWINIKWIQCLFYFSCAVWKIMTLLNYLWS